MLLEILQNLQENTSVRASFLIKLQTLAQLFSCELCKISRNTFFTEHLRATASLLYTTKLRKDLLPMKITICGVGTFFKDISRYVHFQAMFFFVNLN